MTTSYVKINKYHAKMERIFHKAKCRMYLSIITKSLLLGSVGLCILTILACSSNSERFRTRSLTDHSIKYKDPVRMKVTGTGCALNLQAAVRISRNAAQYNLRSIIGNRRYLTSFREVDRYEDSGQVCVETEIESHSP